MDPPDGTTSPLREERSSRGRVRRCVFASALLVRRCHGVIGAQNLCVCKTTFHILGRDWEEDELISAHLWELLAVSSSSLLSFLLLLVLAENVGEELAAFPMGPEGPACTECCLVFRAAGDEAVPPAPAVTSLRLTFRLRAATTSM